MINLTYALKSLLKMNNDFHGAIGDHKRPLGCIFPEPMPPS